MAEISINITTFDAGGGSYRVELTKNDAWAWGSVTVASVPWVTVGEQTNVSPYLYTIDLDVAENDTGSSRSVGITATVEGQSELFTITQPAQSALTANIVSSSPAGNIAYTGGQITVDVESVNGVDGSSSAVVTTGYGFTSLSSTNHGVTSGGATVTRFVFTVNANDTNSTRAILLTFTVMDASNNTATTTLSKTQNAAPLNLGSMSAANASIAASATTANSVVTQSDMDNLLQNGEIPLKKEGVKTRVLDEWKNNPGFRHCFERAPSEECRRMIVLQFVYWEYESKVLAGELDSLANKLTVEDWKHLYKDCGNESLKEVYRDRIRRLGGNVDEI